MVIVCIPQLSVEEILKLQVCLVCLTLMCKSYGLISSHLSQLTESKVITARPVEPTLSER